MNNENILHLSLERLNTVLLDQHEAFGSVDLGTPREILSEISEGLKSNKILVITGLRRVGKSTFWRRSPGPNWQIPTTSSTLKTSAC